MLTLNIQNTQQISSYLLEHLKPLELRKDWDPSYKKSEVTKLLLVKQLILDLGDAEHSGDWDPYIKLGYWDDNQELVYITTQNGYHVMQIDSDDILLEDELGMAPYQDEDISYYRLPIASIHSITILIH